MKIFNKQEFFESKVNFVDENNVLVGYDIGRGCCEHADWFIADEITPYSYDCDLNQTLENESDYRFDPYFFQEVMDSGDLDCGGMVVFRLIGPTTKYLHIFNAHNGYYSHGFNTENFAESVPTNDYL